MNFQSPGIYEIGLLLLFGALVGTLTFVTIDYISLQMQRVKLAGQVTPDLIFGAVSKGLKIVDHWFVDDDTTITTLETGDLKIEYTKFTEPNNVIETVVIKGKIKFCPGLIFSGDVYLKPLTLSFSMRDQALIENDSRKVITKLDAKLGTYEQIVLLISKEVNQGDLGLDFTDEP